MTATKRKARVTPSRQTIENILDSMEPTAREWFETEGRVPVFFIVYSARGAMFVANADLSPDAYASAVRHIAEQHDAYAVATIAEVRMMTAESRDTLPRSFKGALGAVEAVVVMVEHRDGQVIARALIEREVPGDESSKGTLKPFVREKPERVGFARLSHLLPGARDN